MQTFVIVPAEVLPTWAACWQKVDLLPVILTDISDIQVSGQAGKKKSPWVAQSVSPNLPQASPTYKWVIAWYGIWLCIIHINSQDFPPQRLQGLPITKWVTDGSPITHTDVQVTIW